MEEEQRWEEIFRRLDSLTQEIIEMGNALADLTEWCGRNLPVKYVDDYIRHLKQDLRELKERFEKFEK